jgi:serine/threonine-protein kinase
VQATSPITPQESVARAPETDEPDATLSDPSQNPSDGLIRKPANGRRPKIAIGFATAAILTVVLMAFLLIPAADSSRTTDDVLPVAGSSRPPVNSEAYAEYQKGRHFLAKLNAEAFSQARHHFERSLDLDPAFASAWGGLSEAYIHLANMMVLSAREGYPRARAAAERALALDPEVAEAHASLAMALAMYYWDTNAAERHFRRAVELDPGSAGTRRMYAAHLRNLGRFDESLAQIRQAQVLDPFFAFAHIEEGITLYVARRNDEALQKLRQFLVVSPGDTHAYVFLAMVHSQLGQYPEALAALRLTDPQKKRPDAQTIRGVVYARMGRDHDARQTFETLDKLRDEGRPVTPFHKAAIHAALGEHDRALDLLEEAAEQPSWQMRLLKVTPTWDPLRQNPRFQALLTTVGLPQ